MNPKSLIWSIIGGMIAIALVTRLRPLFPIIGEEFAE